MKLGKLVALCVGEGALVASIVESLRVVGRDPVVDVDAAVRTLRGWHDLQWAQIYLLNGMRPLNAEGRERIVDLLRAHVAELRLEKERS